MGLKKDLAVEYLQTHPVKIPSLTLAKVLYSQNPEVFLSVENARDAVRYVRKARGDARGKSYVKENFESPGKLNPFRSIPEGLTDFADWEPYRIDCKKALLIGDIHIPYHDKSALEIALEFGYKESVDCIILMGDFADHFSISRWEKDPRKKNFGDEVSTTKAILGLIRKAFPGTRIIWKIGNHEERYDIYMEVKAPEMLGVPHYEFKKLYHLADYDIELVTDKKIMKIAKLNVIHGHEFGRSFTSPVNPARGLYLRGKENAVCGHYHQSSNHSENSMNDSFTGCWSLGCLSDLHPRYLPINKWNHGFGMVEKLGDKEFHMHNKKIIDHKVYSV